jgi:hypothetical protein
LLERERKGKRWIFNLSSTPTKSTQSLLKIWHIAMGRREERNPSSPRATMGSESGEKEERRGGNLIPSCTTSLSSQPALEIPVGAA